MQRARGETEAWKRRKSAPVCPAQMEVAWVVEVEEIRHR